MSDFWNFIDILVGFHFNESETNNITNLADHTWMGPVILSDTDSTLHVLYSESIFVQNPERRNQDLKSLPAESSDPSKKIRKITEDRGLES